MPTPRTLTTPGNLKQPTQQDVINWVSQAWRSIKPELLTHAFLVCGISNSLDGSQDDWVSDKLPQIDGDGDKEEDEEAEEENGEDGDENADDLDPFDSD